MKSKLLMRLVLIAGLTFAVASPAFANKWIKDINWSQMLCADILEVVDRLTSIASWADKRANQEEAAGNEQMAEAFEEVANEARGEAAEGRMHYDNGDCVH